MAQDETRVKWRASQTLSSSGTHVDMWYLISGRKSTIKDKWIGCNPKGHLEVDKWQEREDNSFDPTLTQPVWGGGGGGGGEVKEKG